MSLQLDCRGLTCPEPVVRCKNALTDAPEDIVVLVDNAASNENVCRLLTRNGYAVGFEQRDGEWHIRASRVADVASAAPRRDEASVASPSDAAAVCVRPDAYKTLILLTTETLGHGSDELGAKLMENFLATLPEIPDLWRVVMLNGGVKLAATPGKNLESLKALEASGVSLLVCGSCLQFYNLLEARAVGETTNMLDVVTSLALADKVIRP